MPIIWTLNCLGCIYIAYIVFLVLDWLSNLEFWCWKKKVVQVVQIGGRGVIWTKSKRTAIFFSGYLPYPLNEKIRYVAFDGHPNLCDILALSTVTCRRAVFLNFLWFFWYQDKDERAALSLVLVAGGSGSLSLSVSTIHTIPNHAIESHRIPCNSFHSVPC